MHLTSKMSHDHGRHDSCGFLLLAWLLHSIHPSLAGGVTDVGVGSGALLGLFFGLDFKVNRPLRNIIRKSPSSVFLLVPSDWTTSIAKSIVRPLEVNFDGVGGNLGDIKYDPATFFGG